MLLQVSGVRVKLQQQLMRYTTTSGGPYCLIEQAPAAPLPQPSGVSAVIGPVFSELRWTWQDGSVQQLLRLGAAHDDVFSITHTVNTIEKGSEMVWRVVSDLASNAELFTDDSGLEMHLRVPEPTLPLSGRYHALVQSAYIQDESTDRQLSVLVTHTMGVASLAAGELEVMFLRHLTDNSTDDQGPWPLQESVPFSVTTSVFISQHTLPPPRLPRALQQEHPLVVAYTDGQPLVQPFSTSNTKTVDRHKC